jgi:hypothetical protein
MYLSSKATWEAEIIREIELRRIDYQGKIICKTPPSPQKTKS